MHITLTFQFYSLEQYEAFSQLVTNDALTEAQLKEFQTRVRALAKASDAAEAALTAAKRNT